jgi:hypothetical protein
MSATADLLKDAAAWPSEADALRVSTLYGDADGELEQVLFSLRRALERPDDVPPATHATVGEAYELLDAVRLEAASLSRHARELEQLVERVNVARQGQAGA